MTALHQQLEALGLTPNQALIYLTLFRMGEAKAGEIIKKTGLHRNLVYVGLQELAHKRLTVSSKIKGISVYKVLSSTRLLADAQEKERIAKQTIEELTTLVKKPIYQEIVVYEGIDEFRRHTLHSYNVMECGGLIRYLGISPEWHTLVGPEVEQELWRTQNEKSIRLQGLAKTIPPAVKNYIRHTKGLSEIKTNPLISSDTNNVEISEDRIAIRSFVEPYFVVEILNKELAKNYQNYFDFLWSSKTSRKI